ncbi:hypothetical protein Tco_1105914 [Tanacetum coccineum]
MNSTLNDTYGELVYALKDASTWEAPNDLQWVLPPLMLKKPAIRPKNTNRILSRRETPSQAGCGRCGIRGHNRNSCTQPLPSNQILPVPFTENFMGLREWDGPAEWRQYSYNPMNNFMPTAGYSSNNTYDPTQPSSSHGYMLHRNAGESSTPYEYYHLDDM